MLKNKSKKFLCFNIKPSLKSGGFTLLELLVVISIISLLSTIVIATIQDSRDKAAIAAGKKFSGYLDRTLGIYAVGKWSFEETNGDIVDTSGSNQTGYIDGKVERVKDCDLGLGNCLYFPGGGIVRTKNDPKFDFIDGVILSAWIKPDNVNGYRTIVSKNWGNEQMYSLEINYGRMHFYTWLCGSQGTMRNHINTNSSPVKSGKWQHVAISIEKTGSTSLKLKFFHNGDLVEEINNNDAVICNSTNYGITGGTQFGANRNNAGDLRSNFIGHMDEVRQIMIDIDGLSTNQNIKNLYAGYLEHFSI